MFTHNCALIVPCVLRLSVSLGQLGYVAGGSAHFDLSTNSMAIIEEIPGEDVRRLQATDPNDEEEEECDLSAPPLSNFMPGDYGAISHAGSPLRCATWPRDGLVDDDAY